MKLYNVSQDIFFGSFYTFSVIFCTAIIKGGKQTKVDIRKDKQHRKIQILNSKSIGKVIIKIYVCVKNIKIAFAICHPKSSVHMRCGRSLVVVNFCVFLQFSLSMSSNDFFLLLAIAFFSSYVRPYISRYMHRNRRHFDIAFPLRKKTPLCYFLLHFDGHV